MARSPLKIGVIGYGYWGPNLVRNFVAQPESTVTIVADLEPTNLRKVRQLFPSVGLTEHASELIESSDVDAVAIATPVSSHFELAKAAIEAGKHVLIEKPITSASQQAQELIALAEQNQVVLMVDHTFVFTGAIRKMRQLIEDGELGELYYFDSERINLGLLQQDVNVLWDLATHDLSILLYLFDESPASVQAIGHRHVNSAQEEMASLNLNYESGFHAHIRVSWLSPVKMRLTLIGGSRKMIVYNDVEPSEKVRVYDKGIVLDFGDEEVTAMKPIYRAGDVFIPELDRTEALQAETSHFLDCIRDGQQPLTGGAEGLAVVKILEAANRSLESGCAFVPI